MVQFRIENQYRKLKDNFVYFMLTPAMLRNSLECRLHKLSINNLLITCTKTDLEVRHHDIVMGSTCVNKNK